MAAGRPESGTVSLPFGPGAIRRLRAGAKRAAVVPARSAAGLGAGSSVVARPVFGDARLPLQVRARHDLPDGINELPALAETAGLSLADFTVESEWGGYLEATRKNVPRAAVVLVLDPVGPLSGTLYEKKKKKSAGLWAWYRVDSQLQPPFVARIHPADQKTLMSRISLVLDRLAPPAETREAVDAVAGVLLNSRQAGGKITPALRAQVGSARVDEAVAWLRRNKLLVGLGAERVWSPRLLVDLRIQMPVQQAGARTPEPDTASTAGPENTMVSA